MSLLLHIDTALENASVCLSQNRSVLRLTSSASQRDHAAWLHTAIKLMLGEENLHIRQIEAIAVSIGPGSYTGLRVGLSAAKGLCFALGIPLITVNTLKVIAAASATDQADLLCPMIDARRNEVFTALYDRSLIEIKEAHAMVLSPASFQDILETNRVLFSGNGSRKFREQISYTRALFSETLPTAADMVQFALEAFHQKNFANLAYTDPLYVKEFYTTAQIK